jgi:hypothetical protein
MFKSTAIRATLLLLFSLLAKEYIPVAAIKFALLTAFHNTRIQQCRIEKLEDEYQGQRTINRAAVENHRAAHLALQQKTQSADNTSSACTRAHYEDPSTETVRENAASKIVFTSCVSAGSLLRIPALIMSTRPSTQLARTACLKIACIDSASQSSVSGPT